MQFIKNNYYDKVFENLNLKETILKLKEFDNCTFKNSKFNKTELINCKFIECSFETCDLSLIKINDSTFNDVAIKDSKAIGINWFLCKKIFDMYFYNSNISMSSFYQLNLKHSNIISCLAHEVDFSEVNLEKVNFENTDLLGSTFDNTKLHFTNLVTAKNYLINPKTNYLKQTKVSKNEAISFLEFLNLDIIK